MTVFFAPAEMSHPKPLIIPWLRAQIDSGRYPGVQWTNQEKTEFCVPWKHALRHDSSSVDVLIFKVTLKQSLRIYHNLKRYQWQIGRK